MTDLLMLLIPVISLVLTWTIITAALAGLGLLVQTAVMPRELPSAQSRQDSSIADCAQLPVLFWVGYAAAAGLLQVWHLIWPIGGTVSLLLLLAGLGSLAVIGRSHITGLLSAIRSYPLATCTFIALAAWAAMHAAGPGLAHDTGMYHYGLLQWFQLEPSVPGLGNLSLLYAHNPAHLLIGAAIDQGPWDGRCQHVLNGLLVFVMGGLAVRGMTLAVQQPKSWLNWYDAMLFVPVVMFILTKELPNPKTDSAPAFLMMMMVRQLGVLLAASEETTVRERTWLLITMAILGATGVIAKLSTAPLVAAIIPVAAVLWWRGLPLAAQVRSAAVAAAVGIVLIGPWMIRNTITSGYPLFPSPIIAIDTDWTLPVEPVRQEVIDISQHGKTRLPELSYWAIESVVTIPEWLRVEIPDETTLTRWNWIPGWLVTMPAHSPVIVFVPVLLIGGCLVLMAIRRPLMPPPRALWAAAIPLLAALAFWFFTAPTHRFATGITWPLAALCIAATIPARFEAGSNARRIALAAAVLLGVMAALAWGLVEQRVRDAEGNPLVNVLFQGPGPDYGFHPRPIAENTVTWRSRHGVEVIQPAEGRMIWSTPQPAVGWPEELDEDLAWREPGNRRAGFRLERE